MGWRRAFFNGPSKMARNAVCLSHHSQVTVMSSSPEYSATALLFRRCQLNRAHPI